MSQVTKVNRRKEIKAKEELQAQFQLAISKNNNRILSWLESDKKTTVSGSPEAAATADEFAESSRDFFNLPIIPNGSGLASMQSADSYKVGDFINNSSETSLNQLKNQATPGNAKQTADSKAMKALRNNLRNKSRQDIEKKFSKKQPGPQNFKQAIKSANNDKKPSKTAPSQLDEDEDEDVAALKSRSLKKGGVPQFGAKGKKKGGRPF